jgi:LmbE family N-acetylglucosaminyl deacetylase
MGPIGDEFLSRQRVLVISPHADDETYGCAGTIARIKDLGGQVYVSLISVGSVDHYAANSDGSAMRRVTSTTRLREFSEVMKLQPGSRGAVSCLYHRHPAGRPQSAASGALRAGLRAGGLRAGRRAA